MFPADAARAAAWPPPERQSQPGWFPLSDAALIGAAPPPPPPGPYSDAPPSQLPIATAYARTPFGDVATYAAWPPDARFEHTESHRSLLYPQTHEHQEQHVYYVQQQQPQQQQQQGEAMVYRNDDHQPYSHVQQQQHDEQQLQFQQQALLLLPPPPPPTPSRRQLQEPAVGRWNAEEHKLFLKGLEMFQGPAWGEIARVIGTRTSTQVRTHAQKFFTKLARTGQSLPYFAAQIQKERSRMVAQATAGVSVSGNATTAAASATSDGGGGTSVTPTSTSGVNFALSNLSPNKRVGSTAPVASPLTTPTSSGAGIRHDDFEYAASTYSGESGAYFSHDLTSSSSSSTADDDSYPNSSTSTSASTRPRDENEADEVRGGGGGSYYHPPPPDDELFKPKLESEALSPLLRKSRAYADGTGYPMSMAAIPATAIPPAMTAAAGVAATTGVGGDSAYGAVPAQQQQQQQQQHQSDTYSGAMYPSSLQTPRRDSFDVPRLHYVGALAAGGDVDQQHQQSYNYSSSHIHQHQHQHQQLSLPPHQHSSNNQQHQHFQHQRSHSFAEDTLGTGTGAGSSFVVATPSAASTTFASDPWGGDGVSPRQWLSATPLDSSSPVDAESLPSMNKLLFRSSSSV